MSNPHDSPPQTPEEFLERLSPGDLKRLTWLLSVIARVEGWCAINRAIGKFILVAIIGLLIVFSNALDAVKNLLGWKH